MNDVSHSPNRSVRLYGLLLLLVGLFLIRAGYRALQTLSLVLAEGKDSRPLTGSEAIYLGVATTIMGILSVYLSFKNR